MSDDVYKSLAESTTGYVIAPAGCGKTEAIVKAVGSYCIGTQLILTHTHAGVGALKKRFKDNEVSQSRYHIETISGWALNWVRHYPQLSDFKGALPIPENNDWSSVYTSAQNLLRISFVQWVVRNSYSGVIVDEYQDCTLSMHNLIVEFKSILPCRILGDPLQGIFDFNEPLVEWSDVETNFGDKIGELLTPHRWIRVNNRKLGDWLIQSRNDIKNNQHPNYDGSPIICENIDSSRKPARLQELARELQGSMCVIGPKHGNLQTALGSSLVNVGFLWAEPNELPDLGELLKLVSITNDLSQQAEAAITFIKKSFTGLTRHKTFVEGILRGTLHIPQDHQRQSLFEKHPSGYSHQLLLDIVNYIINQGIKQKKHESIIYLKRVLEQQLETQENIMKIFSKEITRRKFIGNIRPKRCIGTTLLLKGLEFEHAVILYSQNDDSWNNVKDIYVALTRGSRTVHLIQ